MDARQERARRIEFDKFKSLIAQLRVYKTENPSEEKRTPQTWISLPETARIESLAQSGNPLINQCNIIFARLVAESDSLQVEGRRKYFDALLLYGEERQTVDKDDGSFRVMARFVPFLHRLNKFVRRCNEMVHAILAQLYGFFKLSSNDLQKASDRMMLRVWRCLGDVLSILLVLDEIVKSHPTLVHHWRIYSRSINVVQHNPSMFAVAADDSRLQTLQDLVKQLDTDIMSGTMFKTACKQPISPSIADDKPFIGRFQKVIIEMLKRWYRLSSGDQPDKQRLVAILCLAILYHNIHVGSMDKKMLRSIFDTHKVIVSFHLVGDQLFTPTEFLLQSIPGLDKTMDKKVLTSVSQTKVLLIERQLEELGKEAQLTEQQCSEWMSQMDQNLVVPEQKEEPTKIMEEWVTERSSLILKGAHLADKITRFLKCVLNGYSGENRTISKSNTNHIFKMIQLVQEISLTFYEKWASVLECSMICCSHWSSCALRILETIRVKLPANQSAGTEIASAVLNAEYSLCEPASKNRLIVFGVALELADYTKAFRSSEISKLDELFNRLNLFYDIGQLVARITNCSFLYCHRVSLTEAYLESLFDSQQQLDTRGVTLFLRALNDCSEMLSNAAHCTPEAMINDFAQEMFTVLREKFLDQIFTEVENDLRLTCHACQNVSLDEVEAFFSQQKSKTKSSQSLANSDPTSLRSVRMVKLLQIPNVHIGNRIINVKDYVTKMLDESFYNLTSVALHDHENYVRMRTLAEFRYGLKISSSHLPYMSVSQGLDLLEIIRDLQTFVAGYNYDVSEQIFIEKSSKSRTLNIFRVQQVVNSIKTHGYGVLNSSINAAYQALKKEFHSFSLCLFDEQVKSQLVKEICYYRDSIDELNQMYPMRRAEQFISNIRKRKMGTGDAALFLLEFRASVSRIGNILGLVRMIRSGAIRHASEAVEFIPTEEQIMKDLEEAKNIGPSEKVFNESAEILCSMSKVTYQTFENTNDYIEMLTSVFTTELRNLEKFSHLRHFFMIVPALTINYIDHIFVCRSRLEKQRGDADCGATFVDDGFSTGIAYILTLLNQCYFFDSLNWFDAVFSKFQVDGDQLEHEQKEAQKLKDESLVQSINIKISRLKKLRKEWKYLMYTLQSSLMFFKSRDEEGKIEETYLEEF